MSFALREHTADVAVEATGPTLGATLAAVADGMAAAMCESVPETGGEQFAVTEHGEDLEALCFEYLDRLIVERDVRGVLPVDNEATVTGPDGPDGAGAAGGRWTIEATARGVPLTAVVARDLKAVTYSQMAVEETTDGWRAYVVFDV